MFRGAYLPLFTLPRITFIIRLLHRPLYSLLAFNMITLFARTLSDRAVVVPAILEIALLGVRASRQGVPKWRRRTGSWRITRGLCSIKNFELFRPVVLKTLASPLKEITYMASSLKGRLCFVRHVPTTC